MINLQAGLNLQNATLNLHSETRRGSLNEIPVVFRDDALGPSSRHYALCSSLSAPVPPVDCRNASPRKMDYFSHGPWMGHDQVIASFVCSIAPRGQQEPVGDGVECEGR